MIDDRVLRIRSFLDNQQYSDPDGIAAALGISPATWPLAGLLWDSAVILAELMMQIDIVGKRILEVGCGLGLGSLVLSSRGADVTCTDIHPEVRPNLEVNTKLNGGKPIPYFDGNWQDENIETRLFDLVIGSDLLYQPDHPLLLARFMSCHASEAAQIIVVDPGRGNLPMFGRELDKYGFTRFNEHIGKDVMQANGFRGQVRAYEKMSNVLTLES